MVILKSGSASIDQKLVSYGYGVKDIKLWNGTPVWSISMTFSITYPHDNETNHSPFGRSNYHVGVRSPQEWLFSILARFLKPPTG